MCNVNNVCRRLRVDKLDECWLQFLDRFGDVAPVPHDACKKLAGFALKYVDLEYRGAFVNELRNILHRIWYTYGKFGNAGLVGSMLVYNHGPFMLEASKNEPVKVTGLVFMNKDSGEMVEIPAEYHDRMLRAELLPAKRYKFFVEFSIKASGVQNCLGVPMPNGIEYCKIKLASESRTGVLDCIYRNVAWT